MTELKYKLTQDESEANLTIFYKGKTFPVHSSHKLWGDILKATLADDPKAVELADVGLAVGERLSLTMRVAYANGKLYLDGDEMADGLANHIVRMLQAGDDVAPFVLLLENIMQNPSQNSREQLYRYIDKHDVTITQDGILVLYKFVDTNKNGAPQWAAKSYQSTHSGEAIINGVEFNGYVPQSLGDVVEMPRSKVVDNPNTACSYGLHVGEWDYVASHDTILEVHVHPRDVVSVPRDHNERKIRVCRYVIVGVRTERYTEPVITHTLVKPVKLTQAAKEVFTANAGITPGATAFGRLKMQAKAQKKGLKRYMESKGYKQLNPDGSPEERKNWVLPVKVK